MTFRASLADRKKDRKKTTRGKAIVLEKICPGQACDLPSSLHWLTFRAAGDGGIHLSLPCPMNYSLVQRSVRQTQLKHTEIRGDRHNRRGGLRSTCYMLNINIFTFSRGQSNTQEVDRGGGGLAEMVVTARKRNVGKKTPSLQGTTLRCFTANSCGFKGLHTHRPKE